MEPHQKPVVLYHLVYAHERFADAAQHLWEILRKAQETYPGRPRALYLEIEGHRNEAGGFDQDMYELQKEFLVGVLMPFLTEAHTPLLPVMRNAKPQDNVLPGSLTIV